MMNGFNFNFNFKDVQNLATTKAPVITAADLANDTAYQEAKKKIIEDNNTFDAIVNTFMNMQNANLTKAEAEDLVTRLNYKHIDVAEFEKGYIEKLQEDADAEAREAAYLNAKNAYDSFIQAMGFNTQPQNAQPSIPIQLNMNAVVPANIQEPEKADEIDEKHMSFQDRCEYIEELLSGNSGNTQFRRHLAVRHKNVEAKSLIKEWYKAGYISLSEKNSLLFLANITACSGHVNVTARR